MVPPPAWGQQDQRRASESPLPIQHSQGAGPQGHGAAALLTLLIKAKIRITAFSALGFFRLMLQTLVFLAISGGLVLAAGGAAIYSTQKQRPAVA